MFDIRLLFAATILSGLVACSSSSPLQSDTSDLSPEKDEIETARDKVAAEQFSIAPGNESDSAVYQVTFIATWSAQSHPVMFPSGAHWSGLVGATHNGQAELWAPGELASAGIERMAETGSMFPLLNEVDTMIMLGTAAGRLSGPGAASPDTVSMVFTIHAAHPLVSLVAMIAPSPDWFTGVHALSLRDGDGWISSLCVDLYGWDAGTDHGTTYVAGDIEAVPHLPITALTSGPFLVNGQVPVVGRFFFERVDFPAY